MPPLPRGIRYVFSFTPVLSMNSTPCRLECGVAAVSKGVAADLFVLAIPCIPASEFVEHPLVLASVLPTSHDLKEV